MQEQEAAQPPQPPNIKEAPRWLAPAAAVAVIAALALIMQSPPRNAGAPAAPQPVAQASDNSKQALALMINMHRELCGQVLKVQAIGGDVYEVECTRYRSGEGRAQYTVDLTKGTVR